MTIPNGLAAGLKHEHHFEITVRRPELAARSRRIASTGSPSDDGTR
jgi:hypothetical protein